MKVEFVLNKKRTEVTANPGDGVLETAMRANIDPPYSCLEGVCTACCAKIEVGKVDFPDDTILAEREVKAGKVLTCQSRLIDGQEKVVVNYDAI